jgi:hypothetical protein
MNAIHGRYNKQDSTQVGRRAQTTRPLNRLGRRPLRFYKALLEELRSELLAVRLQVTRERAPPLEQQWEAWLAVFAVAMKNCDKQTSELMRRRHLILGERNICARCRLVFRDAAIRLIDA